MRKFSVLLILLFQLFSNCCLAWQATEPEAQTQATKTEFNPFGDVTKIREPYPAEVTYTYNAWGMPSSMAIAGTQIGLFDERNQLEWTMDPHVTLQLDEAGRLSSVETEFTDDITYRYDAEGRPTSVMYGTQTQYEFNYENQRLRTLLIDGSRTRPFFYDNDHRIARVTDSEQSGNLAAYTYNAEGRVASYVDLNQTQLDYSYDKQGRVANLTLAADHFIPQTHIAKMPGFNKSNKINQDLALNSEDNFHGLPKSFNSSKGKKLPSEWTTYKNTPLKEEYIFQNKLIEQELLEDIQFMIDNLLTLHLIIKEQENT